MLLGHLYTSFCIFSFLLNIYLGVELLRFMLTDLKELSESSEILKNNKELSDYLSHIFLNSAQHNICYVF